MKAKDIYMIFYKNTSLTLEECRLVLPKFRRALIKCVLSGKLQLTGLCSIKCIDRGNEIEFVNPNTKKISKRPRHYLSWKFSRKFKEIIGN